MFYNYTFGFFFVFCRTRGFPPKNIQPGILGPVPVMPRHVAARYMRMPTMLPMAFPSADIQPFPYTPSTMLLPLAETMENSNAGKPIVAVCNY